ncbi:EF-hand domain containing protein [Cryptosporidium tyzzeri]|nr:EF-hand domain containing protein [Cryptosporidium tyzzeri]
MYGNRDKEIGVFQEKIEHSGEIVDATLAEFNVKYQTLFFIATLVLSIAGFFSAIYSLFGLRITNFVNSCLQLIVGVLLLLLDIPGQPRWSAKFRSDIRRQARILSKLTGKSLSLLFLSCLCSTTLRTNNRDPMIISMFSKTKSKSPGLFLLTFLVCLLTSSVAVLGLLISFEKGIRLNRIKKSVISSYTSVGACNTIEIYRSYALSDPLFGMLGDEFNRLISDRTDNNYQFSQDELSIIFNALDDNQKGSINEREFVEFFSSRFTLV